MRFHTTNRYVLAALIAFAGSHACAQESAQENTPASAPAATQQNPLAPVEISSRTNVGDMSYKSYYDFQALLRSYLPPEPRVIDFTYRLAFKELDGTARDEYLPDTWAVAVVGDTVDQVIPVSRGGYFVLPELPQASTESATVMFNAQTRWRSFEIDFKVRIADGKTLSYADFAKGIEEFKGLQRQIPWYRIGLRTIRNARVDGLKACFGTADARIEIDGETTATKVEGLCDLLPFDPVNIDAGSARISFVGPLEYIVLDVREN